jgi:hypothetical protein
MTNNDEEHLLIDMLIGTRQSLMKCEQDIRAQTEVLHQLQKAEQETEQAIIDYCQANGVVQFSTEHHSITLGNSEEIVVYSDDMQAIPEEYARIITIRRPDKIKIKNTRPQGNWYTIKQSNFITLRSK